MIILHWYRLHHLQQQQGPTLSWYTRIRASAAMRLRTAFCCCMAVFLHCVRCGIIIVAIVGMVLETVKTTGRSIFYEIDV